MRKVSFALAHCFQTCLPSLACCSTCLIICLLTKIALKNLSNRSKITLKFLAVYKLVCTFARQLLVSREIILVSREIIFVSREIILVSTILSESRAGCETSSREIKTLVSNFARAWNSLARPKICLARRLTSSRGLERFFARNLVSAYHLFGLFLLFASRTLSPFEFVIVLCLRTVLYNDTLLRRKHDSCTLTSLVLSTIFCLCILMLVNTLRRVDHNLWLLEPINQITRALVNSILTFILSFRDLVLVQCLPRSPLFVLVHACSD